MSAQINQTNKQTGRADKNGTNLLSYETFVSFLLADVANMVFVVFCLKIEARRKVSTNKSL